MKKITKKNYYIVVGLMELAKSNVDRLLIIEKTLADVLKEKSDSGKWPYYGHISDCVWGGDGADELLSKMGIKITWDQPKKKK